MHPCPDVKLYVKSILIPQPYFYKIGIMVLRRILDEAVSLVWIPALSSPAQKNPQIKDVGIIAAQSLLARHWPRATGASPNKWGDTAYQLPVNPGTIIHALKIALYTRSAAQMPENCYGLIERDEHGNPSIVLNGEEHSIRRRFAAAHMLGHIMLGHQDTPPEIDGYFSISTKDERERLANHFAAELLVPNATLVKLFSKGAFGALHEYGQAFAASDVLVEYKMFKLDRLDTIDPMYMP